MKVKSLSLLVLVILLLLAGASGEPPALAQSTRGEPVFTFAGHPLYVGWNWLAWCGEPAPLVTLADTLAAAGLPMTTVPSVFLYSNDTTWFSIPQQFQPGQLYAIKVVAP